MIFTEVHLLAGKLVLVVAIHSLRGSRARGGRASGSSIAWHRGGICSGNVRLGVNPNALLECLHLEALAF